MNRTNSLSKGQYIFDTIHWSILFMIVYRSIIFRTIHGVSFVGSKLILWAIVVTLIPIETISTWHRYRNKTSVFTTIFLPFVIYTLISYWKSVRDLFIVFISIATVLSIMYLIMLWSRTNVNRSRTVIKRKIIQSLASVRTIAVSCLAIIPLILGVSFIFRGGYVAAKTKAAFSGDDNKLANNIAVVARLDEDTWPNLSTKEKLEVLQTVANVEAHYLGLPHELNVQLGALDINNLASYDDKSHIVTINIDHIEFDPPEEILDSVCHECYHALQRRACDAYDTINEEYKDLLEFYNIQVYEREFSNYVTGRNGEDEYYDQLVERYARAYAASSVKDYYKNIYEYLGKVSTSTDSDN